MHGRLTEHTENENPSQPCTYEHGDNEPETPPKINDHPNVAMQALDKAQRAACSHRHATCNGLQQYCGATKSAQPCIIRQGPPAYALLQEWLLQEMLAPTLLPQVVWPDGQSAEGLLIPPHTYCPDCHEPVVSVLSCHATI
jgi:hypothetical protein